MTATLSARVAGSSRARISRSIISYILTLMNTWTHNRGLVASVARKKLVKLTESSDANTRFE